MFSCIRDPLKRFMVNVTSTSSRSGAVAHELGHTRLQSSYLQYFDTRSMQNLSASGGYRPPNLAPRYVAVRRAIHEIITG
jgi:hypothetical protein